MSERRRVPGALYRQRRPTPPTTPTRPRAPSLRALGAPERQAVLDVLHSERFVDQSPAEVHATLLEEQTYLCAPRTMYRVLAAAHEVRERRAQARHPAYTKPELVATGPNQVWSWDITKLKGSIPCLYYSLYVILDLFTGNYDFYERERALREANREAAHARQQAILAKEQRFIDRFASHAAKAAQVQSRVKALDKIEKIKLPKQRRVVKFNFQPPPRSGDDVAILEGIDKRYGSRVIYDGLNLNVRRGERWAVMGRNGAGKTTLLRLIAGALEPDAGSVRIGASVKMGYFAQQALQILDPKLTVEEQMIKPGFPICLPQMAPLYTREPPSARNSVRRTIVQLQRPSPQPTLTWNRPEPLLSGHFSDTAPHLCPFFASLRCTRPRVSLPAPAAPRSSAASRRRAAGSDDLPPAGASSIWRASPAGLRFSPAAAGDSSATSA